MPEKRKRGRPATGSLVLTPSGYAARLWVTKDGERIRDWLPLGTFDERVARRKLRREVERAKAGELPKPEQTRAEETVDSYAREWLDRRDARGIATTAVAERRYYEKVWRPVIGSKALGSVKAADIRAVLEDAAIGRLMWHTTNGSPKRYTRTTISHIRAAAYRLFAAAWRDEIITTNPVERVELPDVDEVKKPRAVLTDAEIGTLIAHPDVDAELKLLVLLSRTIGGMRAGDLNSLDWTAFSPEFATCTIIRRKTRKKRPYPQTLEVPEPVRPFLLVWWQRQGSPVTGPVFPTRVGPNAGKPKKQGHMSYADRLRAALLKARIDRHELHHETATTMPVDFHSTRRAYASALARAGVNAQTAMVLTGHADPLVHQRYVEAATIRALPVAALPPIPTAAAFLAGKAPKPPLPTAENSNAIAAVAGLPGKFI